MGACLRLEQSYAPTARNARARAKVLYLLNARQVLNGGFHEALAARGVTSGQLAMWGGVSRSTAARILCGKAPSPDVEARVRRVLDSRQLSLKLEVK